jgi:zinc protease
LAYSVSSSIAPFDFAPLHMGGTSTKNERVAESLSIIEAEITSLAKDGPFDEELDVAKKYLTGSYLLRFDTSQKLASQLVQIQIDHLGQDYMDRRNGLISSVTREEAARVAKRLYGEGKLLVTIVGRPVGIDAVKA